MSSITPAIRPVKRLWTSARVGEVAADIQQVDRLACGPGFEVVQGVIRLGEQVAGEGVDGDGLLDLALRGRVDGLRLGQHRGEPGHRGDGLDERGSLRQQVRDQEQGVRVLM